MSDYIRLAIKPGQTPMKIVIKADSPRYEAKVPRAQGLLHVRCTTEIHVDNNPEIVENANYCINHGQDNQW